VVVAGLSWVASFKMIILLGISIAFLVISFLILELVIVRG